MFSCAQTGDDIQRDTSDTIPIKKDKIAFDVIPYLNRAFILTDSIMVYDKNRLFQKKVYHLARTLVTIDSISKSKYFIGSGDSVCDVYNMIKIRSGKVSGWVYGKDVYEFTERKKEGNINKDTVFTIQSINFRLYVLQNFGPGFEDEEGLTFCGEDNPVALYNSKYDRLEVIPVNDPRDEYTNTYMSLDLFDGWEDEIKSITFYDNGLLIGIKREFQEGLAHIELLIHLNANGSEAEVIKYSNIIQND